MYIYDIVCGGETSRARSTKTRIETASGSIYDIQAEVFESTIHENKD